MATSPTVIPPPPDGFSFDAPPPVIKAAGGIPPPPDGFSFDAPPAPSKAPPGISQQDQARIAAADAANKPFAEAASAPLTDAQRQNAPGVPKATELYGLPTGGSAELPSLKSDAQLQAEAPIRYDPRTGEPYRAMPLGTPLSQGGNPLDFPFTGSRQALDGVYKMAAPVQQMGKDIVNAAPPGLGSDDTGKYPVATRPTPLSPEMRKQAVEGVSDVIEGGLAVALPLTLPAAAMSAPLVVGRGLLAGVTAQELTSRGLKEAGVGPEYARFWGNIAGVGAGFGETAYKGLFDNIAAHNDVANALLESDHKAGLRASAGAELATHIVGEEGTPVFGTNLYVKAADTVGGPSTIKGRPIYNVINDDTGQIVHTGTGDTVQQFIAARKQFSVDNALPVGGSGESSEATRGRQILQQYLDKNPDATVGDVAREFGMQEHEARIAMAAPPERSPVPQAAMSADERYSQIVAERAEAQSFADKARAAGKRDIPAEAAVLDADVKLSQIQKQRALSGAEGTQLPQQQRVADTAVPSQTNPIHDMVKEALGFDPMSSAGTPEAEAEPQPTVNVPAYKKALDHWQKLGLNATEQFLKENPGTEWADAEQAVAGTYGIRPEPRDYAPPPKPPEPPAPPPEPVPPTQVDRTSEHTPNPPTAATATEPESPQTIALQMQQLAVGQRRAVMFPKGMGIPDLTSFPAGVSIHHDDFGNIYAYRPDLIQSGDISKAAKKNTLTEILGHSELGMGAPDKAALQGDPIAVVGHAPDGTEAQSTIADEASLPQTIAATKALTPPGGTVTVMSPEEALAARQGVSPTQTPPAAVSPTQQAKEAAALDFAKQAHAAGIQIRTSALQRQFGIGPGAATRILAAVQAPPAADLVGEPEPIGGEELPPGPAAPANTPPAEQTPEAETPTPPSETKAPSLTTREQATAVKDLGLDTSGFDTKTVEGRKQLVEAIAKEKAVSAVDKSVHDLPVKATLKDGQITAIIRYQRKPVATVTISLAEWQQTLEHPNPNYPQRQLAAKKLDQSDINVFIDNSDNERMNSGVVNRLADSVVNAVKSAIKVATASLPERTPEPAPHIAAAGVESNGEPAAQSGTAKSVRAEDRGALEEQLPEGSRGDGEVRGPDDVRGGGGEPGLPGDVAVSSKGSDLGSGSRTGDAGVGSTPQRPLTRNERIKALAERKLAERGIVPPGAVSKPAGASSAAAIPTKKTAIAPAAPAPVTPRVSTTPAAPRNAMSDANEEAEKRMREWMRVKQEKKAKEGEILSRPRLHADPGPVELDEDVHADLAAIGTERILSGSTNFSDWSANMMDTVGDLVNFVADDADTTPTVVLRLVHEMAREIAKTHGVEAEETPGDEDAVDAKGDTTEEVRLPPKDPEVAGTRFAHDYRISDDRVISGSPERRAAVNIEAIRVLRQVEAEQRAATIEEKHALAAYVGWGAIKPIFTAKPEWADLQTQLRNLVSPEEFEHAARSVTNSHYTGDTVVNSMWSALRHLGATRGMSWLEPAVGVGNFFGRQPTDLLEGARRLGIDKDTITSKIARLLYPDSGIDTSPFEQAELPADYFDAAVSNIPFGEFGVHDPAFKSQPFLTEPIHNYFFAKALTVVRPGGLVAFVTSRYTMDGYGAGAVAFRRYVETKADFIGAVRLPAGAFRQNAGTDVITDIIFLRRRAEGVAAEGPSWVATDHKYFRSNGRSVSHTINAYYQAHPEMVLGEQGVSRGQFSDHDYDVSGTITEESLTEALKRLPANQFREWKGRPTRRSIALRELEAGMKDKIGSFFFDKNGNLFRKTSKGEAVAANASAGEKLRIQGQLAIRDVAALLMSSENKPDVAVSTLDAIRKELNDVYDNYVKTHGLLSNQQNQKVMAGDPDAPLLPGLERNYEPAVKKEGFAERADKAPIFTKRLLKNPPVVAPGDAKEALYVTLNHKGSLDWEYLKGLTGQSDESLQQDLAGIVFKNPETAQFETAEEYLSGSVRQKLRAARAIAKMDPYYEANIKALESVQPVDIPPSGIRVQLGSTWVPLDTYSRFIQDVLGLHTYDGKPVFPQVRHIGNEWHLGVDRQYIATKWDTKRVQAIKMLDNAINLRRTKVYDRGDPPTINKDETLAAAARQKELNEYFEKWIFKDTERGDAHARLYNDIHNDLRKRLYDGSHLQLPGMSRTSLRGGTLEPHQLAAVWRQVAQRNVLLAHAVGAGKTYEMIAAAMELKRLGLIQRPMFVVPNATLTGWQDQFSALYPQARVIVFSEADLVKEKRRLTVARMATGDWDAVVIPHSSFQFIPVGEEIFNDAYRKLEAELTAQIMEAEGAALDTRMVRRMEVAKERLLTALQNRRNRAMQDNVISWEQLGIDQLYVDESHEFKKLGFTTKQPNVAGIDYKGNQKTFDLMMKIRHTQSHGRGVTFATGTPVTNTMGELYSIMNYLIQPELEARGIARFDDWATNYARTTDNFEPKPEGGGYQMKARLSRFVNLPELGQLLRSFADVVLSEDLTIPRPSIAGGARRSVLTVMNPEQEEFQADLQRRASSIRRDPRRALPDGMLVVYGDAGKMALDIRMVEELGHDDPGSRVNKVAEEVYRLWKLSAENKGTQLVFSDIGVPSDGKKRKKKDPARPSPGKTTNFGLYDNMIQKMVDLGIPRNEIATIYDAKNKLQRAKLFRKMNRGDIRVLLGSRMKMGQGVNVQERGFGIHQVDIPPRPSDLEQSEGRFNRQGNTNPEIHIIYYMTKGTLDENKFGSVVRKGKFINSFLRGDSTIRESDDVDGMVMSLEHFQAATSGDPRVFRKLEVDNEIDRLYRLESAFSDQMYGMRRTLQQAKDEIERLNTRTQFLDHAKALRDKTGRVWVIEGETFEGEGISEKLGEAILKAASEMKGDRLITIGTGHGLEITANLSPTQQRVAIYSGPVQIDWEDLSPWMLTPEDIESRKKENKVLRAHIKALGLEERSYVFRPEESAKPATLVARLENSIRGIDGAIRATADALTRNKDEVQSISKDTDQQWPYQNDLDKLLAERKTLEVALGVGKDDDTAAIMDDGEEIEDDSVEAEDDGSDAEEEDDDTPLARPRNLFEQTGSRGDLKDWRQAKTPEELRESADAKYEKLRPGHGHLYVNEPAADILKEALNAVGRKTGTFDGLAVPMAVAQQLDSVLAYRAGKETPAIAAAINNIRAELDKALSDGVVTIVNAGPDVPAKHVEETEREEVFHRAQMIAVHASGLSHVDVDALKAVPLLKKALANFRKLRRSNNAATDQRAFYEVGAMLASGQAAELRLSPIQAAKALTSYLDHVTERHGEERTADLVNYVHPGVREGMRGKYAVHRGSAGEHSGSLHSAPGPTGEVQRGLGESLQEPGDNAGGDSGGDRGGEKEPLERTAANRGVVLGSGLGGLQPAYDAAAAASAQFIREEVLPKVAKNLSGAKDIVQSAWSIVNPRYGVPTKTLDAVYKLNGGREAAGFLLGKKLDGWSAKVNKMTKAEMVAFIDSHKTGVAQTDPDLKDLADFLRIADDSLYQAIRKYRPTLEYLENHYRVLWKVIPGSPEAKAAMAAGGLKGAAIRTFTGVFRRPLQGSKGFLKQHTLDDMSEGLALGGVPYSYNPLTMFMAHYSDTMKFLTAQRLWAEFEKTGVRQFVKFPMRNGPVGYKKLNDAIAKVYFPVEAGMVNAGEWYVEEGAARLLNNMLSRDYLREVYSDSDMSRLTGNLGSFLLAVKNVTTAIELSLSPFHAVFEGNEAVASTIGMAMSKIWNIGVRQGNLKAVGEGAAEMATSPKAAVTMAKFGSMAKQVYSDYEGMRKTVDGRKWLNSNPAVRENIPYFFLGGGKMAMPEEFRIQAANNFKAYLNSARAGGNPGHYLSAGIRAIPAANQAIMAPLFEHYIPNLKLAFFLKEFALSRQVYADRINSGEMTLAEVARNVIDSVENRFGEMNFDNLYWNRMFKTAAQILFRSVTWKLGNLRLNASALSGQTKELGRAIRNKEFPILDRSMGWFLGNCLWTAILGSVITYIATRDYPHHLKDLIYPVIDKASGLRVSIPTYLRDQVHLSHDPGAYVKSSLAGDIGKALDVWQNSDFYHNEVRNPDDSYVTQVLDSVFHLIPTNFGVSSYKQATQEGGNKASKIAGFLGFPTAPRYIGQSDAERLATEYAAGHREVGSRTATQASRAQAQASIRNAYRSGTDPAPKIKEAEGKGLITRQDASALQKQSRDSLLKGILRGPKITMPEALRIYDAATPEERKQIEREVRNKVFAATKLSAQWGDPGSATRNMAQKYFKARPNTPPPSPIGEPQPFF